ncbi:hypothetical protein PGB90_003437 [Kerria lacca]
MFFIVLLLPLLCLLFDFTVSSVPCGQYECSQYQYCSKVSNICKDCSELCLEDTSECRQECPDYYWDTMRECVTKSHVQDMISDLDRLLKVVIFLLVLLLIMVGGLVYRIVYRYFKRRRLRKEEDKKFKEKLSAVQYTVNNNTLRDGSVKCITQTVSCPMPSMTTLTTNTDSLCGTNRTASINETLPLSKEEPSEDTTLDYASYINQGMSHSPSKENGLNTTPKY